MAIQDNYVPVKELGNGVTTQFSGNWAVLVASYIRVYLENVVTGVQTLQTGGGVDYSLTFDPNNAGFVVTFTVAPTSANYVVIGREVALSQDTPYKTSQGFQGIVEEKSFDKLTAMVQDHQDQLDRTPKFPLASGISNIPLPLPEAGKALIWNVAENALINSTANIADLDAAVAAAAASAASALASQNAAAASAGNAATSETNAAASAALAQASVGAVKVTVNDTTAGVLNTKLLVGGNLKKTVGNPAGNETLTLDFADTVNLLKGTNIASAATTNIAAATGNFVHITGTITITAFGTVAAGALRWVTFDGVLTLTHNATSLILPGAANIVTAAGDGALFISEGSGNWRCLNYTRASGRALIANDIVLGTPLALNGLAAANFTGLPSGVKRITMTFSDVSTTGTDNLLVQIGDSGGLENTGYISTGSRLGVASADSNSGFLLYGAGAANIYSETVVLNLLDSSTNLWLCYSVGQSALTFVGAGGGRKSLTGTLDRISLLLSGANTFDAGTVNITYEV